MQHGVKVGLRPIQIYRYYIYYKIMYNGLLADWGGKMSAEPSFVEAVYPESVVLVVRALDLGGSIGLEVMC